MKAFLFAAFLISTSLYAAEGPKVTEVTYKELKWQDDVYYLNGRPYTGLARDTFKDGKPKGEYPFKEGKLHGLVKEWWENGQLSTETNFENGQRHGLNRYWSKQGHLMKEQVYDHDRSVSEKHHEVKE
jgi:antitoxin component YwqK of YwqJK toxin-antitoxin module